MVCRTRDKFDLLNCRFTKIILNTEIISEHNSHDKNVTKPKNFNRRNVAVWFLEGDWLMKITSLPRSWFLVLYKFCFAHKSSLNQSLHWCLEGRGGWEEIQPHSSTHAIWIWGPAEHLTSLKHLDAKILIIQDRRAKTLKFAWKIKTSFKSC